MHECKQQSKISAMEAIINDLHKTINGDGQPGLKDVVIRLDERYLSLDKKYCSLNDNVKSIATSMSGLVKFQTEIKTERRLLKSQTNARRWLIGIIVALVIGLIGVIFAMFD